MPYIKPERRLGLAGVPVIPQTSGELNYLITRICEEYRREAEQWHDGKKSYSILNEIIGALECAKLEYARRIVYPYEDEKIAENGDVYDLTEQRPTVLDDVLKT